MITIEQLAPAAVLHDTAEVRVWHLGVYYVDSVLRCLLFVAAAKVDLHSRNAVTAELDPDMVQVAMSSGVGDDEGEFSIFSLEMPEAPSGALVLRLPGAGLQWRVPLAG